MAVVHLLKPDLICRAASMCDKFSVVINDNGEFSGIYIQMAVNGIMRVIKVDEDFDKTFDQMCDNPLLNKGGLPLPNAQSCPSPNQCTHPNCRCLK